MKHRFLTFIIILASTHFISAQVAGNPDSTFNGTGIVTTDITNNHDHPTALAIQPDGKIVLAGSTYTGYFMVDPGDLALARYNTDGSPDNTFGTNGTVVTDLGGFDYALNLKIQTDGKIVVCGTMDHEFLVARYNSNGTPDNSFGASGKTVVDMSPGNAYGNIAFDLAIQPDGKIIAAGYSSPVYDDDFALIRLNSDGTLDNTFSGDGMLNADLGGNEYGNALALQPDGKIIMVGNQLNNSSDVAVARFNADGTFDNTFGNGGIVITDVFGSDDEGTNVLVQDDGKILVIGDAYNTTALIDLLLIRYNADGTPDNTFGGGDGIATSDVMNNAYAWGTAAVIQPDGKIVATGYRSPPNSFAYDFGTARFSADGILDPTFGTNGWVVTDVGTQDNQAYDVALQDDGKVVIAGVANILGDEDFVVVRYINDLNIGIDEINPFSSIQSYPNPASDAAIISFELKDAGNLKLSLYDEEGRSYYTVREGNLSAGKLQLQLNFPSQLTSGFYYLRLSTANGNAVVPVVIER
ncbi:MAG TPA: T9SS type A sorting domain-containing protein [Chitinophagales bacterium]|nr:T9SS type A sorting domain-containing protein [Chitinophagales bacterium]